MATSSCLTVPKSPRFYPANLFPQQIRSIIKLIRITCIVRRTNFAIEQDIISALQGLRQTVLINRKQHLPVLCLYFAYHDFLLFNRSFLNDTSVHFLFRRPIAVHFIPLYLRHRTSQNQQKQADRSSKKPPITVSACSQHPQKSNKKHSHHSKVYRQQIQRPKAGIG